MDRKLILFCGLGTSGKDFWAEKVMQWYAKEYTHIKAVFVGIAQARRTFWPKTEDMTDADHLLKNEITLLEVEKQFVIFGVEVVVLNMTMLTEAGHQLPFLRMLSETEFLLTRKLCELKARELNKPLQEIPIDSVSIGLRTIWMTCNEEATLRRIVQRQGDANTTSGVVTLQEFRKGWERFEPPTYFSYLKVDTSDESEMADVERERMIRQHIFG